MPRGISKCQLEHSFIRACTVYSVNLLAWEDQLIIRQVKTHAMEALRPINLHGYIVEGGVL